MHAEDEDEEQEEREEQEEQEEQERREEQQEQQEQQEEQEMAQNGKTAAARCEPDPDEPGMHIRVRAVRRDHIFFVDLGCRFPNAFPETAAGCEHRAFGRATAYGMEWQGRSGRVEWREWREWQEWQEWQGSGGSHRSILHGKLRSGTRRTCARPSPE